MDGPIQPNVDGLSVAKPLKPMNSQQLLERMQTICLALPEAKLDFPWGEPHFKVKDKIFAGCGAEDELLTIGFKLEKDHAASLCLQKHVWPSKYVGKHGWVTVDVAGISDWQEIERWVNESYRLIAPANLVKQIAPLNPQTPLPAPKLRQTGNS